MGLIFYTVGVQFYLLIVIIFSLWNKKAKLFIDGRKNIFEKINNKLLNNSKKLVWFHCSSLGEFEQARPVIEGFKLKHPEYFIFLTFFSPSGYEVRKNYELADAIFYLPIDSKKNAHQLIQLINPSIVYFVKYDFWYYYLHELKNRHTNTILFSANFRENQLFFKPYGHFYRQMLFSFNHIFVQNTFSAKLLENIGYKNVTVAGDTRFDRVIENVKNKKSIPLAEKFKNNKNVLIIGSSWEEDMEIIIPLINQFPHEIKYIIAPHEIKENFISDIENKIKKKSIRFSKADLQTIDNYDVLIIDNVGMLSSLYQYGEFAYVGGGFKQGLHNILEPSAFGLPVIFGPEKDFQRFPEAKELLNLNGATTVSNFDELNNIVLKLYQSETYRQEMAKVVKNYILDGTGATEKILLWQ